MEQNKRCAACGQMTGAEAKFCPNCGSNQFLAPAVRCRACGRDVPYGKYCAHCGADLQNPGAQVWRNCGNCGNPVHITQTHCTRCGAAYLPPVQPRPKKKRGGCLALLLILLVFLVIGLGVGISDYLENAAPQLNTPHTTVWQDSTRPTFNRPTQPQIPRPTTQPVESMPGTAPTEPQQTEPTPTEPAPTQPKPTEPTPTEPTPTEPTPTEPEPTEPESNIPAEFRDNYYLVGMGDGYCETMTGDMVVLFVFVSDPTDGWTEQERAEAEPALLDELRTLLGEAASYDVELNIRYVFANATITTEFNRYSQQWKKETLEVLGFDSAYRDQRTLETYYQSNNVPVVFLVDEDGRSYANMSTNGNGFESVTICQKDYAALRHEMCHVFGAEDMYFPQVTTDAAKEYLPNGIMYGDCKGDVDALTAFVIGWTDVLTDEAIAFLWATNGLTAEDIEEARQQDQLTGYGTKYVDGGHYTGYMVGGVYHGEGTFYWDDGYTYSGTWVNGKREGYGELTGPGGYSYKGYWKENAQHGTGTVTYVSGDTYTGDFVNDQRHGQGTYTWTDGSEYTGAWVDGQRTGRGVMTWPNGMRYEGDFVAGLESGKGYLTWADGSYYMGDFQNGKMHGKGEYYYAQYGTMYVGDFVNGKRHGWGTYYYADGTTYTGRWENDARVD